MVNLFLLGQTQAGKPALLGLGIAALVVLFLAFKVTRLVLKMILMLAVLAAVAGAAWYYLGARGP